MTKKKATKAKKTPAKKSSSVKKTLTKKTPAKSYSFLNTELVYNEELDIWHVYLPLDSEVELSFDYNKDAWFALFYLESPYTYVRETAATPEKVLAKLVPFVENFYKPVFDLFNNK